jgi:bacterial/archaeal transporter family-2 protein
VLLILAQLYASPAIGAASFLGIIVTVGVAASLVLDHYGWVGFPVHPASLWRILGAVLMVAGVALVALF